MIPGISSLVKFVHGSKGQRHVPRQRYKELPWPQALPKSVRPLPGVTKGQVFPRASVAKLMYSIGKPTFIPQVVHPCINDSL